CAGCDAAAVDAAGAATLGRAAGARLGGALLGSRACALHGLAAVVGHRHAAGPLARVHRRAAHVLRANASRPARGRALDLPAAGVGREGAALAGAGRGAVRRAAAAVAEAHLLERLRAETDAEQAAVDRLIAVIDGLAALPSPARLLVGLGVAATGIAGPAVDGPAAVVRRGTATTGAPADLGLALAGGARTADVALRTVRGALARLSA